jgi:CheY-like chemotaxis protein
MTDAIRIVVAAPHPEMRDYFRETLALLGHEVVDVVRNGTQLIERVLALDVDLVLTDCQLDDMHADRAVETITRNKPVPFVYVCNHEARETHERIDPAFIVEHLVKPVGSPDLERAIANAIQGFGGTGGASF